MFLTTKAKEPFSEYLKAFLKETLTEQTVLLDAGCGRGDFEAFLNLYQIPCKQVIAIDSNPEQLAEAKQRQLDPEKFYFRFQDYWQIDYSKYPGLAVILFCQSLPDDSNLALLQIIQNFGEMLLQSDLILLIVPPFTYNPFLAKGIQQQVYSELTLINWLATFSEHFSVRVNSKLFLLECRAFKINPELLKEIQDTPLIIQSNIRQSSLFEDF